MSLDICPCNICPLTFVPVTIVQVTLVQVVTSQELLIRSCHSRLSKSWPFDTCPGNHCLFKICPGDIWTGNICPKIHFSEATDQILFKF